MAQLKDFQTGAVGDSFNGPVGTTTAAAGAFTTLSATGAITSTLATGTAPLVIASTTKVANLNVDLLDGADWAAPAALGSTTPAAVSATTLSASSTVSGTGFSTYLASPPAIGGTAAAAGSFTTLSATGAVTLSGGTANGVAYLNGSKVVTSGSALTFDGTTFVSKSNAEFGNSLVDANRYVNIIGAGGNKDFGIQLGGSRVLWQNTGQSGLLFGVSDTEAMRLTSTGLGIGTSSPTSKLTVSGAISASGTIFRPDSGFIQWNSTGASGGTNRAIIWADSSSNLYFGTGAGNSTQATLDSAGNLGLGVTPSAWGIGKTFQVNSASLMGYLNRLYASANTYFDGTGTAKYIASDSATSYQQLNGQHQFFTAPSGTAGNAITFTQAMTLDASGNLGIGQTAPSYKLEVAGSIAARFANPDTSAIVVQATTGTNAAAMRFNNTGGNAYVGLDNSAGSRIGNAAYSLNMWHEGAYPLCFGNNNTERARIDSSGNLLVGTTAASEVSNVGLKLFANATVPAYRCVMDTATGTAAGYILYNGNATNNGYRFYVQSNGGIANYQANDTNLSDERTKTEIQNAGNYLAKICAIPVRTFKYKDQNDDLLNLGCIAQEVELVAPELVDASGFGKTPEGEIPLKSIYQTDLQYALMKCIQEQQAIIESLKARLDAANL
jgi:hypothetical protein